VSRENDELRDDKWWLRLLGSHRYQGWHLLEGLCNKDEEIQIQANNDVYRVDPTPGAGEMTDVAR